MLDFNPILNDYGFTTDNYDFETTIIGFSHDIHAALLDTDSCFDIDQCQVLRQWDDPNAHIRCELVTRDHNIQSGMEFFDQQWVRHLRYDHTVCEVIIKRVHDQRATIQVLCISKYNAMTIMITIQQGVYEQIKA